MPRSGVVKDEPLKATRGKRGGLSVTELRKRLKALGLKVTGSKAELEARYQAALNAADSTPMPAALNAVDTPTSMPEPSSVETPSPERSAKREHPDSEDVPEAKRAKQEMSFEDELEAELASLEKVAEAATTVVVQGGDELVVDTTDLPGEVEELEDLLPDRYRLQLERSPFQDLIDLVMSSNIWWWRGLRSLVKNLFELNQVEKSELPKKMDNLTESQLSQLLHRFQAAVYAPLKSFANHLKPALARRIHVGTMDYMGGSHEAYRRTFEFIEMTNTWFDLDSPNRELSDLYRRKLQCSYKDPEVYKALADRAVDSRDSFRIVVKVSCVATHIQKLQNVQDWWPRLWKEKYSHLAPATVAFLWQFPPSFVYSDEIYQRLERLADYLGSSASGVQEARHIVDFRDGSWYRQDVYDFLKERRWCLAWLHLNNSSGWASNLPSGWTDRVQTTNFVFCRLFGPDGQTHGTYNNKFLHELFDSCPMGTTSYVLFGNKETLEDSAPDPVPATVNAVTFRTIFTKMDFVERIRDVRYKGMCPRILDPQETLLINSFYLRFSQKARDAGIKITSPVCSQWTQKYVPEAPLEKRSFEWYFPETGKRLHLGLHDAKEEEDLWIFLRQLTGLEDLQAAKDWCWSKRGNYGLEAFKKEEVTLLIGALIRWSKKARDSMLLSSTRLYAVDQDGTSMQFLLSNGEKIWLSCDDMKEEEDIWKYLQDLSRVPSKALVGAEQPQELDPWQDGSWKRNAREMWTRVEEPKPEETVQEEKGSWWEDTAWRDSKAKQATQSSQWEGRSSWSNHWRHRGRGGWSRW